MLGKAVGPEPFAVGWGCSLRVSVLSCWLSSGTGPTGAYSGSPEFRPTGAADDRVDEVSTHSVHSDGRNESHEAAMWL